MAGKPETQIRPISNIVIVVGNLRAATVCYVLLCFCLMVLILMNNSYGDGSTSHRQQIPAHSPASLFVRISLFLSLRLHF